MKNNSKQSRDYGDYQYKKVVYLDDDEPEEIDSDDLIAQLDDMVSEMDDDGEDDNVEDNDYGSSPFSASILDDSTEGESYHLFQPTELKENENPFDEVIGHKKEKEELLRVIDWFNHSQYWMEKGIMIPRGVLLYGRPGTGKTMMMRALIRLCQCPVLVYQGKSDNPAKSLSETFQKAKELSHAVILIDELDLIVKNRQDVQRVLQQNMDGVEDKGDILIIAAANNISEIPDALQRSGRFGKQLFIDDPRLAERIELFKHFAKQYQLKLPEDLDEFEIGSLMSSMAGSEIKAMVNDIILRNGFDNVTQEQIEASIQYVDNNFPSEEKKNYQVAIHEAGHCIMALKYPKYFTADSLTVYNRGGLCHTALIDEEYIDYYVKLAHIQILMAGNLAEKLFFKSALEGCHEDLNDARIEAYNLVNAVGYKSCWRVLPRSGSPNRRESQVKLRKNERIIERILRKSERQAKWYLRKHKKEIKAIADKLYEKAHLNKRQIKECLEGMKR